jgi:hypothetical protein
MGKKRYKTFNVSKNALPGQAVVQPGWRGRVRAWMSSDRIAFLALAVVVLLPLAMFGLFVKSLFRSDRMVTHDFRVATIERKDVRGTGRSNRMKPRFIIHAEDGRTFSLREERMPQTIPIEELESRLKAAGQLTIVTLEDDGDVLGLQGTNLDIPWMDGYRNFRADRKIGVLMVGGVILFLVITVFLLFKPLSIR